MEELKPKLPPLPPHLRQPQVTEVEKTEIVEDAENEQLQEPSVMSAVEKEIIETKKSNFIWQKFAIWAGFVLSFASTILCLYLLFV